MSQNVDVFIQNVYEFLCVPLYTYEHQRPWDSSEGGKPENLLPNLRLNRLNLDLT
jgi:hypothetical protein